MAVAERLRIALGEKAVTLPEGSIPVTMSAGVTTSDGTHRAEILVKAADMALYRAKNHGRNHVEFMTPAEVLAG
jgi:diguanylate cyclase (GGDEF)-like protein